MWMNTESKIQRGQSLGRVSLLRRLEEEAVSEENQAWDSCWKRPEKCQVPEAKEESTKEGVRAPCCQEV